MTEELDTPQSENVEEEETTLESEEVEETPELDKAKEVAENQKIRAEKAEKELKALKAKKPEVKEETPKKDSLSGEDVLALVEFPNKDDRAFIVQEAKDRGKTVQEIVDDPNTQIILKAKEDERTTAKATSTGKGNRGGKNISPESIVEAHQSGKEIDPEKLAEAELEIQMKEMKSRQ